MLCIARKRKKIYKRLLLDIWGYYATREKLVVKEVDKDLVVPSVFNDYLRKLKIKRRKDQILHFFAKVRKIRRDRWRFRNQRIVYQLEKVNTFYLPKMLKRKMARLKLFRYFYMFFSKYTLFKWFKYSLGGVSYFLEEYMRMLEGNIMMLTYRLNFLSNLFLIPFLIKKGHFMINFKSCYDYRESLKFGDWFGVSKEYIKLYQISMYYRLERGTIYQTGLKNFFFNYTTLLCIFYKVFKKDFLLNPIKLDILRVHDMFRDIR